MSKKILIAVVGPTAIGKTSLSINLAQYFKTEIVSADSRQFFKEMQIGTAVPSPEELKAVPHHFIQHKSIFESYSVGDFERDAISCLDVLFKTKEVVIMVGGSGLYMDAVVNGIDVFPEVSPEIRRRLLDTLKKHGIQALQEGLKKRDGAYYKIVDLDNPHRLIRALEVCLVSNQPYSSFLGKEKASRPFETIYLGIKASREIIYERINKRVDTMIASGLVEEAKALFGQKDLNALQTVGYKELFKFFGGDWTLTFAISEIKKNTRRFAKRQLTWYRKNENILWVDHDSAFDVVTRKLEKRLKSI